MVDEVLYELGVDIDNSYSFHDGDIVLSSYDNNLVQAITNRLNTELNELDLFYDDYGSVFRSFFGWKSDDETINFMKSELETVLSSEPRLNDWEYEINYTGTGTVRIDLKLYPNPEYSIETTLILGNNGIETEEE